MTVVSVYSFIELYVTIKMHHFTKILNHHAYLGLDVVILSSMFVFFSWDCFICRCKHCSLSSLV